MHDVEELDPESNVLPITSRQEPRASVALIALFALIALIALFALLQLLRCPCLPVLLDPESQATRKILAISLILHYLLNRPHVEGVEGVPPGYLSLFN